MAFRPIIIKCQQLSNLEFCLKSGRLLLLLERVDKHFKILLSVTDQERGGWGPWSQWSPCSSSCFGTRTRYRFCDSPPPRYGAKFCEVSYLYSFGCSQGTALPHVCTILIFSTCEMFGCEHLF